jgi:putative aldouronate transport system permease protein
VKEKNCFDCYYKGQSWTCQGESAEQFTEIRKKVLTFSIEGATIKSQREELVAGGNVRMRTTGTRLGKRLIKSWQLYVLVLPALVYIIVFAYAPMYGVQIAFKDYKVNLGIMGSPWTGLKYFRQFVTLSNFWQLITNTLALSVYSLLFGFPAPILLALLLNQLKYQKYKSFVQTVTYAPYFISTVVMVSMLNIFLAPTSGFVNNLIVMAGGKAITFTGRPEWFRTVYVASGIWQGCG